MDTGSDSTKHAARRFGCAVLLAGCLALVWLGLFAAGQVTIGVEGEWTWNVHRVTSAVDVAIPIAITAVLFGCAIPVLASMATVIERNARYTALVLPLLVGGSFVATAALQSCAPTPHRQLKPMWVLYDWGASGYFVDARRIENLRDYLTGYEEEMAEGDVLHKGTHPPGLVVANRVSLELCRRNAWLADAVWGTVPSSVEAAFERQVPRARLPAADRAALWLSVLVTQFAAALTVVPLFFLLRSELSAGPALMMAALWPLVPGVAVFLPKSDAVYTLFACISVWLATSAWNQGSLVRAGLAGLMFWFGMLFSLAMLPTLAVVGVYALLRRNAEGGWWKRVAQQALVGGGVFVGASVVFWLVSEARLWAIWARNYTNHAGFYDQFPRTYWKWLAANPLELLLTVGAPLLTLGLICVVRASAARDWSRSAAALSTFSVWLILWASGKNMGEAARLWVFLTPLILWGAASALREFDGSGFRRIWYVLAISQAVIAVATVSLVNGFSGPLL